MDRLKFKEESKFYTELPNGIKMKAEFDDEEETYFFYVMNPKNGEWERLEEEGNGKKKPLTESSSFNVKKVIRRIAYGMDLAYKWGNIE